MTNEQMQAELERLRTENEALKKGAQRSLFTKVSEKGAISVYGLNARFPVTLYLEQWEKLQSYIPTVIEFGNANKAELDRISKLTPEQAAARKAEFEKAREAKKSQATLTVAK